jgi:hypothetical protein
LIYIRLKIWNPLPIDGLGRWRFELVLMKTHLYNSGSTIIIEIKRTKQLPINNNVSLRFGVANK